MQNDIDGYREVRYVDDLRTEALWFKHDVRVLLENRQQDLKMLLSKENIDIHELTKNSAEYNGYKQGITDILEIWEEYNKYLNNTKKEE